MGPSQGGRTGRGAEPGWAWFVGLATLDVLQRVDHWPGPNEKLTSTWHEISPGGPATNAAMAHAALGGTALLSTALGSHAVGQTIRGRVEAAGVRVDDRGADDTVPAVSSIILSGTAGDRAIVSADGTGLSVEAPGRDPALDGCGAVLLDGHHPRLALWAARAARAAGVRVVVDAGRWKPALGELLGLADDVVCSADFTMPGAADAAAVLEALLARGVRRAAITRGRDSVLWASADGGDAGSPASGRIPVPSVEALDTLAAGDVFHGAYVHAVVQAGIGFPEALAYAAAVTADKVQVTGQVAWLDALRARRNSPVGAP